jgi:hypothetical protein
VFEQSLVEQVAAIFEERREEALKLGGQACKKQVATARAAEESLTLLRSRS